MRFSWWLSCVAIFGFLASCNHNPSGVSTNGTHPRNTGPFDRNGNYIESWANQPSRWGGNASQQEIVTATKRAPAEPPQLRSSPARVEPKPSQRSVAKTTSSSSRTKSSSESGTKRASSSSRERESVAKTSSKSTKSSSTKPKSSSKSSTASSRYTVKKGDSLAAIAKRNGTTVAKLQKANSIKGSTIRPGQAIKIPK